MVENNLNSLAETLARTGLASSSTQAIMMAKSIIGTEKKVSKHFDGKANEIDTSLSKKKSYNEEIHDLIQKTSPEKKDFHYMISGYKKDVEKESKIVSEEKEVLKEAEEPTQKEPSVTEILDSAEIQSSEKQEKVSVKVEEI